MRSNNKLIMLLVFTDGSTINNGKKNAKGGIGVYIVETSLSYEKQSEYSYSERVEKPTNQKCELLAIKQALLILNEKFNSYKGNVMIYSDSMYSINCVTKWYKNWKNNGWKNSKNQDVKNKEIIQDILSLLETKRNIQFHHIRSHQPKPDGDGLELLKWEGNENADSLASTSN